MSIFIMDNQVNFIVVCVVIDFYVVYYYFVIVIVFVVNDIVFSYFQNSLKVQKLIYKV